MTTPEEFYIGYEGPPPPGMRQAVRAAIVAACAVGLAGITVASMAQRPLPEASFEFGRPRSIQGWLRMSPAPSLLVPEGDRERRYWLVAEGKFGAERELASLAEGWVSLQGARIARDTWQMLEIVPGTVTPGMAPADAPPPPHEVSTPFHARGEIVDPKCHLGVMNPGDGAAHRDCAVRCLSGGIPAMFRYRDPSGAAHLAVMLDEDGRRVGPEWTRRAGTSLELSGRLVASGDAEVLFPGR
jgi:hypothetical protein